MPCSRMPKWSTRPAYGSAFHIFVDRDLRDERRRTLDGRVVGLRQVGRAAPELRHLGGDGVDHGAGRLAGGHALGVGRPARAGRLSQPSGSVRVCSRSKSAGSAEGLRVQAVYSSSQAACAALPRSTALRVCSMTVFGDLEGLVGVEAQHLLGRGDLVVAEGRAVRLAGVLRVGRGPGDDRAQHDEAGLVGDLLGVADRLVAARARPPCTTARRSSSRRSGRASRRPRSAWRRPR